MKRILLTTAAFGLAAGMAQAGGVDRSGQGIGIIFEKGNYAELSFGMINPSVSGTDLLSAPTGSVAGNHTLPGIALKYDLNEQFSATLIYGQDYGADIFYPVGSSPLLGGTMAELNSDVLTGILRYRFDDNWSAHAGLRASKASGEVTLAGLAYAGAGLDGYNVVFDDAWGTGYLVGAAYERPDIALRVALTYFSKVTHDLDTTEMGAIQSVTSVDTPQAVNLDFQTGIAANTLLFGAVRWVDWSEFLIQPSLLGGASLTDLEDTTTYTLGVGRKFNDNWSGSVFASYEPEGDPNVSPLAPTNGYKGIGVGVVYTQDNMKVTMGARYLDLGDANAAPGGTPVASMTGNHAVALGVKVGFNF